MSIEEVYNRLREKEGFKYDDETVKSLPYPGHLHRHSDLWKKRADSSQRFLDYLQQNSGFRKVLDFACGNGWFTARISELPGTQVSGWDINRTELEQAKRLFQKGNIDFQRVDIFTDTTAEYFDLIALNACIQYFKELKTLIDLLLEMLNPGGEIHILDSPVYSRKDVISARIRSESYFSNLHCPKMIEFYHHHTWEEFEGFSHQILFNPDTLWRKILGKIRSDISPFPWIVIRKQTIDC